MSKKTVTGEDGKQYTVKVKKPWYKRFWAWVGIIIVLLIVGTAMGSGSEESDSSSSDTSSSTASSTKEKTSPLDKTYTVGQTVTYKGYSFKVNKVNYYSGNDMNTPEKSGDQFVIANVTISNKSDEKQDYNQYDFQLNADGNATDFDGILTDGEYADNDIDSGTLDTGASVTGNLIGEAKSDSKLKLEYKPSFWDDKTVDVNLN